MRRLMLVLTLLAGCQLAAPGGAPDGASTAAIQNDAISVTTLEAAPDTSAAPPSSDPALTAQPAGSDTPLPKPRPANLPQAAAPGADPANEQAATPQQSQPAEAAPPKPISPEQALCEKSGGQWSAAGKSGLFVCQKKTRDSGKSCRKQTDCEGLCLARSGTCAPIKPLYGCNEVLNATGRLETLCID